MLLRNGDRTVVCRHCGASVRDGAGWCGSCGDPVAAPDGADVAATDVLEHRVDAAAAGLVGPVGPAADAATDAPGATGLVRRSGRWRPTAIAAVACVGLLLVGALVATGDGGAVPTAEVGPGTLLGRLDDTSGRSSSSPPVTDLTRLWTATASPDGSAGVTADVLIGAVGDDLVLVGDRVLALADGRVVAQSAPLLTTPGAVSGETGRTVSGWVFEGRLLTVDALRGTVVRDVAVGADAPPWGWTIGYVGDVAVVVGWDGDGGVTAGIDSITGEQRWSVSGEAYEGAGEGWYLAYKPEVSARVPATFLVDGATGSVADHPPGWLRPGVPPSDAAVVDGVAVWLVEGTLVATDTGTGDVLWERPADGADDLTHSSAGVRAQQVDWGRRTVTVRWYAPTDGRLVDELTISPAQDGPQVWNRFDVLDDGIVAATSTGLALIELGGGGWEVPLEDVLGVRGAGDGAHVVALTGRIDRASNRFVGGVDAVVLRRDGTVVAEVPVGPIAFGAPWRFVTAHDGELLLARDGERRVSELAAVRLEDGRVDRRAAVLARYLTPAGRGGAGDPGSTELVGTVLGGPGVGGVGPLLVDRRGSAVAGVDRAVDLGALPPLLGEPLELVAGGRLVVATEAGAATVPLPAPGEGVAVDEVVGRAVGRQPVDDRARPAAPGPVVEVPGVQPVAGLGDLLLGVGETEGGGLVPVRRVVGVDPHVGRVLWRSDVLVPADQPFGFDRVEGRSGRRGVTGAVRATTGTVVLTLPERAVALDPGDGSTLWTAALPGGGAGVVLVDGLAVLAGLTEVVAVDVATGRERWRRDVGDVVTAIDGAGDVVVVGGATGVVSVLDADGAVVETVRPGGRVDDLAVVDGVVLVVDRDGTVTAFGPPASPIDGGRVVVPAAP